MAKINLKTVKKFFPDLSEEEAKLKLEELNSAFAEMTEEEMNQQLESLTEIKRKYFITEKVLKDGYAGRVGDKNFVVASHVMGETFNEKNEKVFGISIQGGAVHNGKNSGDDFYTDLSPAEVYALATAGVIITTKEDREVILNHISSISVKKVRK